MSIGPARHAGGREDNENWLSVRISASLFLISSQERSKRNDFYALNLLDRVGGTRFSLYDYGRGASPVVVDKLHPH